MKYDCVLWFDVLISIFQVVYVGKGNASADNATQICQLLPSFIFSKTEWGPIHMLIMFIEGILVLAVNIFILEILRRSRNFLISIRLFFANISACFILHAMTIFAEAVIHAFHHLSIYDIRRVSIFLEITLVQVVALTFCALSLDALLSVRKTLLRTLKSRKNTVLRTIAGIWLVGIFTAVSALVRSIWLSKKGHSECRVYMETVAVFGGFSLLFIMTIFVIINAVLFYTLRAMSYSSSNATVVRYHRTRRRKTMRILITSGILCFLLFFPTMILSFSYFGVIVSVENNSEDILQNRPWTLNMLYVVKFILKVINITFTHLFLVLRFSKPKLEAIKLLKSSIIGYFCAKRLGRAEHRMKHNLATYSISDGKYCTAET